MESASSSMDTGSGIPREKDVRLQLSDGNVKGFRQRKLSASSYTLFLSFDCYRPHFLWLFSIDDGIGLDLDNYSLVEKSAH